MLADLTVLTIYDMIFSGLPRLTMKHSGWYEEVNDNSLEQGDLVPRCPVVYAVYSPPTTSISSEEEIQEVEMGIFDVVVLTQSCDLRTKDLGSVIACPYYSLFDFLWEQSKLTDLNSKQQKALFNEIRKGERAGLHLLDSPTENLSEARIVDFRTVFSFPSSVLREVARRRTPRNRLLSPYREHLSQAFARFFMRVGLPVDVKQKALEKAVTEVGNKVDLTRQFLNHAKSGNKFRMVETLWSGAVVNAQDRDGRTALMEACDQGNVDIAKELWIWGADMSIQDAEGHVAWDFASAAGHSSVLEFLERASKGW